MVRGVNINLNIDTETWVNSGRKDAMEGVYQVLQNLKKKNQNQKVKIKVKIENQNHPIQIPHD